MYKVIVRFMDLQDVDGHVYEVGDVFPHKNINVSKERIEELTSDKNKIGVPLIEEIPEEASPLTRKARSDLQTGETSPEEGEAKKKPRRGKKNDD